MQNIKDILQIYAEDKQAIIVPCSVSLAQGILDRHDFELPIPQELYNKLHATVRLYIYVASPISKVVCFCGAVKVEKHDDTPLVAIPISEKVLRYDVSLTKIKVAVPRKARLLTTAEQVSIESEDIRGDSQPIKAVYIPLDKLTPKQREQRRALNRRSQRRLRQRRGGKTTEQNVKPTSEDKKQTQTITDSDLRWGG